MSGINAFGTQLKRGDGQEVEVFTAIADATGISGPGLSRETVDVTSHGSPDAWMEFRGGLKDGGEVSVDINYQPAVHDLLVADLDDDEPRNYQLVMTGFEPDAPYDDKLSASLTFKVTGKPTLS